MTCQSKGQKVNCIPNSLLPIPFLSSKPPLLPFLLCTQHNFHRHTIFFILPYILTFLSHHWPYPCNLPLLLCVYFSSFTYNSSYSCYTPIFGITGDPIFTPRYKDSLFLAFSTIAPSNYKLSPSLPPPPLPSSILFTTTSQELFSMHMFSKNQHCSCSGFPTNAS